MNLWIAWNPSSPAAAHLTDDCHLDGEDGRLRLLPSRGPGDLAIAGKVTPLCEIQRREFERMEPISSPTAPLVSCIGCVRAARLAAKNLEGRIPGGLEL